MQTWGRSLPRTQSKQQSHIAHVVQTEKQQSLRKRPASRLPRVLLLEHRDQTEDPDVSRGASLWAATVLTNSCL